LRCGYVGVKAFFFEKRCDIEVIARGYGAGGSVHQEVTNISDADLSAQLVDGDDFLLGFDLAERDFFRKDRQI
jgi:hypothetical protein